MTALRTSRSLVALFIGVMLVAALPTTVLAATGDNRTDATVVAVLPYVDGQNTSDATTAVDDPECAGNGHTVWYRYDAAEALDLQANTFGSDYDTTLSVYVDDGAGGLIQLACNDDWNSLQSQVFWTSEPGVSYWLMVGAFADSPGGNLAFGMGVGTGPPPPPEPEPIAVSIDVLGVTLNRTTGHLTVDLSVTCSQEGEGYVFAEIRQRFGRSYLYAYGDAPILCGPEATLASLTTFHESGVFSGGSVLVRGGSEVVNEEGGYGFGEFEETVRARMVR